MTTVTQLNRPKLAASDAPVVLRRTAREAAAQLGCSLSTFLRNVQTGLIPQGDRVGKRARRWRQDVLDDAVERINAESIQKHATTTSPIDLIETAAVWLAAQKSPPQPVVPSVQEIFGLDTACAVAVAARVFELRTAAR